MKLIATATGEWPPGLHWTAGEVREVEVSAGAELPPWLSQDRPKKGKKGKKTDTPDASEG
jgi:hypothetical protein